MNPLPGAAAALGAAALLLCAPSRLAAQDDAPPPPPGTVQPELPEGAPTPAAKAGGDAKDEMLVTLNFDNADIKSVLTFFSDITQKNYLLTDTVRGNVTVISPVPIPVDELPKVLESILEVRGLATVPIGNMIKIIPRQEAVKSPIDFETEEGVRERVPDEAFVTQIIPLQYAALDDVKNLAQTLSGKNASVIAYPPANTVIISDAASSLARLMKIIKEVDVPGLESTITVVPLQYAAATIMAEEVLSIIAQKGAAGGRAPAARRPGRRPAQPAPAAGGDDAIKIFADERTNALIVVASPEDTERVLALVEELDRQTPESKTRVRVKRLSYSNSDDVANVLTSLTSTRTGEGMPPVTVTSYPEINAIVIDASPQDYDLLQRIIEDLDIPRDQVMVEVIVTEVNLARSLSVDFQTQTLKTINFSTKDKQQMGWDNTQNWGGTEFGSPSLRTNIINDLDKGYPISGGGGFNFGFIETPDSEKNFIGPFGVLLNALEADTDINVLAAPQVLTCDNEEVQLKVVDNIPVVSSTLTTGAGTTGTDTIQQIDYRDVGTEITLTPHISKDRFVRLEVHQKIDQLVGVTLSDISGPLTPATLKRETQTVINIKDGHTVVISGMIGDSYATQESKVPILGDIPIAGLLARFRKNSVQKVNLMIFITPRIVRNPTELAMVTQKTRDRGDEFLQESHGEPARMLEKFFEQSKDEPVKKMPPAGEAKEPYGLKNAAGI